MGRVMTVVGVFLGAILIFLSGFWGTLAVYFDGSGADIVRTALASAYALISLIALAGICFRPLSLEIRGHLHWNISDAFRVVEHHRTIQCS